MSDQRFHEEVEMKCVFSSKRFSDKTNCVHETHDNRRQQSCRNTH